MLFNLFPLHFEHSIFISVTRFSNALCFFFSVTQPSHVGLVPLTGATYCIENILITQQTCVSHYKLFEHVSFHFSAIHFFFVSRVCIHVSFRKIWAERSFMGMIWLGGSEWTRKTVSMWNIRLHMWSMWERPNETYSNLKSSLAGMTIE